MSNDKPIDFDHSRELATDELDAVSGGMYACAYLGGRTMWVNSDADQNGSHVSWTEGPPQGTVWMGPA